MRRLPFSQYSFCDNDNRVSTACTPIVLAVAQLLLLSDDDLIVDEKSRYINSGALRDTFKRGYEWWRTLAPDGFMTVQTILRNDSIKPFVAKEHFGELGRRAVRRGDVAEAAFVDSFGAKPFAYVVRRMWHRAATRGSRCAAFTYRSSAWCLFLPSARPARGWFIDSHPQRGAEVMCFDSPDAMIRYLLRVKCGLSRAEVGAEMDAPSPHASNPSADKDEPAKVEVDDRNAAAAAAAVTLVDMAMPRLRMGGESAAVYRNAGERNNILASQYDLVELTLRSTKAQ